MKAAKYFCNILVLLVLLLFLITPQGAWAKDAASPENSSVFANNRPIYIGDIFTLNIMTQDYSQTELEEIFADFEIVEIKEESGGYAISLRTLIPGEYTAKLGDKEIIISVASTLDDIQREDIFSGGKEILKAGFYIPIKVILYTVPAVLICGALILLLKTALKKRIKKPQPYQLFLQRAAILSPQHDNYFVDLTLYFKEYLEQIYNCRIKGKTSTEISAELIKLSILPDILPHISAWLTKCDRFKFTGLLFAFEEKNQHYHKLLELVENIERQRAEAQKEGEPK
ncbi:MAG: hypothetical protein FWG61_03805 [Firmicutes bacterium]|nr:hypothetical protein [Bacillota bacterium]